MGGWNHSPVGRIKAEKTILLAILEHITREGSDIGSIQPLFPLQLLRKISLRDE
jgi:hypothetical protein